MNWMYLVCVFINIFTLMWVVTSRHKYTTSQSMLVIIACLGGAGYYWLSTSVNLEEAIVAQKLLYLMGAFAPMLTFMIICNICRIVIRKWLIFAMYLIQIIIYLSICSMGRLPLYYKSVTFHHANGASFLTKEYGPFHTLYLIMLLLYTVLGIAVVVKFRSKGHEVSTKSLNTILITYILSVSWYFLDRFFKLTVDVFPIAYTIMLPIMFWTLGKINFYVADFNTELVQEKMAGFGYIYFDHKFRFMGGNKLAREVFPEIQEWEIERKVPGSGGRFNTYLRQALMSFPECGEKVYRGDVFKIKDTYYQYTIGKMRGESRLYSGYYVEIEDVTKWR